MTKSVVAVLAALLLVLCASAFGQNILEVSSTPAGYFIFGGGYWPNSEYRYGEAPVTTSYTASLHHPTYLNVLHYYSQGSGGCNVKVYISTGIQSVIDRQTDPHCHQNWWNAASANPDYYVGEFYCSPYPATLTTYNIESWIASHPATDYCILFDQQDGGADVCIFETWLGPQGTIGILEPQQCPSEAGSSQPACSPNPSTGRTTIRYCVSRPGTVSVRILDVTGRAVRSLCSGHQAAGTQTAMWDGLGDAGSRVPAGSCFFEVTSDGSRSIGKIQLQ